MRIWMFMLGGLWVIPAVAAVGPYLVLNGDRTAVSRPNRGGDHSDVVPARGCRTAGH